jgi:hypothetical protein
MYWQAQVVAFLRDCKDCGWDFDAAWDHALRRYPPRGTGFGNGRKQTVLFDFDDGEHELSLRGVLGDGVPGRLVWPASGARAVDAGSAGSAGASGPPDARGRMTRPLTTGQLRDELLSVSYRKGWRLFVYDDPFEGQKLRVVSRAAAGLVRPG